VSLPVNPIIPIIKILWAESKNRLPPPMTLSNVDACCCAARWAARNRATLCSGVSVKVGALLAPLSMLLDGVVLLELGPNRGSKGLELA